MTFRGLLQCSCMYSAVKICLIRIRHTVRLFFTFHFLAGVLAFVLIPGVPEAQRVLPVTNNRLTVKKTDDFTITGSGSAANWKNAAWNRLLQHDNKTLKSMGWYIPDSAASVKAIQYETLFKILYSNTGLYCLFQCEDSVITATLKSDFLALFKEDVVEVFLRPDTAFPGYFEYELSPLNYELPLLIINNKGRAMGWQPFHYTGIRKISHQVKVNVADAATGRFIWTTEFFIPFALLRPVNNVPPAKGTVWRANFYRIDYDRRIPVYYGWQLTRESFHDPERFGVLEFE